MKAAKILDAEKVYASKEKRQLEQGEYEEILAQLKQDEVLVAMYYFRESTNIAMLLNKHSKEVFELMIEMNEKNKGKFIAQLMYLYAIPQRSISKYF